MIVGMQSDHISPSCNTGVISEFIHFGIQDKKEDPTLCVANKTGVCAGSLSTTSLQKEFDKCINKTSCKIKNLKSYVVNNKGACQHDEAVFHAQYFCK